jgi:D-proline reductase (dithiol) PrdB
VAIVTTAGLRLPEQDGFGSLDQSFRVLPADRTDLVLSHFSPNWDRTGLVADLELVLPVARLRELEGRRVIGKVSDVNIAFMGAQDETMGTIRVDTGPAAAKMLRDAGVDVVLLTPV